MRDFPVSIKGVVTYAGADWGGRFFVQDATAGVFVDNISERQPKPGDYVRIFGITHPGGFAPAISRPYWEKLGTAPLPPAKPVPIERLMAGVEDSQRVEVIGIVRTVRPDKGGNHAFEIASGGFRLRVFAPLPDGHEPDSLIGARVRLHGTAATSFNGQLRHLLTAIMYVPFASDFIVEETEPGNPFDQTIIPIHQVAQYRRDHAPGKRVHIKGTVTYQRPGEDLFLQDATGGLQVKSKEPGMLKPGDVVEVVGFPEFENFLPILQDAVFKEIDEPCIAVTSKNVVIEELHGASHHAELITLHGKVIDRILRRAGQTGQKTILTLQGTNLVFTVEGPVNGPAAESSALPIGSLVEVSGVSLMQIAEDGKLESLQILLPTWDSMRILQKPSWLTPERLMAGLGLLSAVLVLAASWIVTVSRKNAALKNLIRDKVNAQAELQQAHDLLEQRVAERTAQLKFEMTAREEAEVQFKATLVERTRLAQELHDTLEQSLTGIRLQLDTAVKLFNTNASSASHHLELARHFMTQSQIELRRSIWDLRSRELEQFDLPSALRINARQILETNNVRMEIDTTGSVRPLSEVVEENMLRISQEALTNVIKHAKANHVWIRLDFGSHKVTLQIKDDGRGFISEHCSGSHNGHFGLLGMSERAKRLNGSLRVTSAPGSGTSLEVEIPVKPAEEIEEVNVGGYSLP